MKNNNWQFVSFELAKEMKELGFQQESLFYYLRNWNEDRTEIIGGRLRYGKNEGIVEEAHTSAYSVAELLKKAPAGTSVLKRTDKKGINPPRYYVETWETYHKDIWSENPADAIAKLFIYLAKNKLIDPSTI